jgi:hypothetical protein
MTSMNFIGLDIHKKTISHLARALEGTPAQGALEDHHDLLPGSPSDKGRGRSFRSP